MRNLKSKVVVITGASAGVGRATAYDFAKHGAEVVLLARNGESLQGAVKEVEAMGGRGHFYEADVADAEKIEEIADDIEKKIGPIECWVNNAMNSVFAQLKDITPKEYKRVTDVTYLGQVYGTMAALKHMIPRNRGKIVLVGSALAYRGIPLQSAYCGAKHGIQGFFDSLRCELLHEKSNIELSMVQLPALNTTQFGWVKSRLPNKPRPMGTIFQPEVAARAILYASLHDRREIYVAMPSIQSIVGNKFLPGMLDKMLAKTGISGQQTDQPEDPNRKDNLWDPVPGNHSAHGTFDQQAKSFSPMFWVSTHWRWVWAVFSAIIIVLLIFLIL